jgi:hypothetical protein
MVEPNMMFDFHLCTFIIQINFSYYKWLILFLASFLHYYIPCDKYLLYLQTWRYSKNLVFSLSVGTHLWLEYMLRSSFKLLVLLVIVICDERFYIETNKPSPYICLVSLSIVTVCKHIWITMVFYHLTSGLCRGVNAMYSGILHSVAKCSWHSFWTDWPMKMGLIGWPKMSVTNRHSMPRKIAEECGSETIFYCLLQHVLTKLHNASLIVWTSWWWLWSKHVGGDT